MATGQDKLEQDIQALLAVVGNIGTAVTNISTALDAFLALPPVVDLTQQDDEVNAAASNLTTQITNLQTETAKIPPPPPGP